MADALRERSAQFFLLGRVQAVVGARPVNLVGSRQEIMLSLLLLEANRVVSVDRMIDAVWVSEPPKSARSQVHMTVSALRQLLGDDIIVTRAPGYMIRVPDDAIDLSQFRRLTESGARAAAENRIPEAVHDLRSALSLWYGHALDGIQSAPIRAAATRLNEWRTSTLQDCLDLELGRGRHAEVVGELTELTAAHPLNERFRGQLMLALYRSGRQAEALATFRAGREYLQEELGLDPSPELCSLEQAVLTRDARIDLAGPSHYTGLADQSGSVLIPRQLPRTATDFAGREQLLAEISQYISGHGTAEGFPGVPVVVLTGRGGVGKTALAVRAAHLLSEAFPDGQIFLQHHADMCQSTTGRLEHLLMSVGMRQEALPGDVEGRAAMYRSWLAGRRVLVVIDGASSPHQITPYLPGTRGCAAIVTTCHRLGHLEGVREIEVGPLDERAAFGLLATHIGGRRMDADSDAARELLRLCEGMPLVLRIVSAKLLARPHWPVSHMVARLRDEARRLDELDLDGISVRATLAVAYGSLDPQAKVLLRRLGLLGTADFACWVGAPLMEACLDQAEDALQKLVESHLVEARIAADDTVRFYLHDLVRIYAVERLAEEESTAARLDAVTRLLSCWLFIAVTAYRRVYGGDFANLHGSAAHWPLSPDSTEILLRKPADWFRSEQSSLVAAILRAAKLGLDELCWDLAVTSNALFEAGPHSEDWRETHAVALELVRRTGNRRGEGALLYSLGTCEGGVASAAASCYFEQSLKIFDEIDDKQGSSLALSGLARVLQRNGKHDIALRYYHDAISGFRAVGDKACEAHTLMTMALIYADWQDYRRAERLLRDALAIAEQIGVERVIAQVLHALGELKIRLGKVDAAAEIVESVLRLTRDARDVVGQAYALVVLGDARRRLGELAEAERSLRTALDLSDSTGHRLIRGRALLAMAELEHTRGRDDLALAWIDDAMRVFREYGCEGVWQARAKELLGRVHERAGRAEIAEHAWQSAAELAGTADRELADRVSRALARLRAAT